MEETSTSTPLEIIKAKIKVLEDGLEYWKNERYRNFGDKNSGFNETIRFSIYEFEEQIKTLNWVVSLWNHK